MKTRAILSALLLCLTVGGMALPCAHVQIEANHTFRVKTRTLSGSYMVPADADSAPSYSVYEGETTPAILTGTMTKFDSKTGYYSEEIACTAANGFEIGKSYNIRIEATVSSVTDFAMRCIEVTPAWSVNEVTELKTILGITDTGTPDDTPDDGVLYLLQGALLGKREITATWEKKYGMDGTLLYTYTLSTDGVITTREAQ